MQNRMMKHQMGPEAIDDLLEGAAVACIATVNADGTPYVVPIHFVYSDGAVYFHGLPKGQKFGNLSSNPAVSLTVYDMKGLLVEGETPCDVNTEYRCAVITGRATVIDDPDKKRCALGLIVAKYMSDMSSVNIPDAMVDGTGVVKVEIDEITGKYYP